MARFCGSGHPTIKAMMEGHNNAEIPKQGNNSVCLAWALKGQCSRQCKRAAMHIRYNPGTICKLNDLLTVCSVAATQQ